MAKLGKHCREFSEFYDVYKKGIVAMPFLKNDFEF
jgi:hypothetical protein